MSAIEKDPLLRSTITSVWRLDESPNRIRFEQQMERATCEVPRLRQLVVSAPFNLGLPEFAIGPNFDPKYNVRWLRAQGDASWRDLLDMAAPLDERTRSRASHRFGLRRPQGRLSPLRCA
jgi:diacylglycerol O-acyltransferase / wax synthase